MSIEKLTASHRLFLSSRLLDPFEWPQISEVIEEWLERQAIPFHLGTNLLPSLMCEALSGKGEAAIPVSAAWTLQFLAAKVFDSIQDRENQHMRWFKEGPATAISYGLGLVGLGNRAVTHLKDEEATAAILAHFSSTMVLAAQSQTESQHTLIIEEYFENIIASTAQLFSSACWAGARVVTADPDVLEKSAAFGLWAGVCFAIRSDCEGMNFSSPTVCSDLARGIYKLPVLYAATQTTHPENLHLLTLLEQRAVDQESLTQISQILENIQAVEWSLGAAELYLQKAYESLDMLPCKDTSVLKAYAAG